MRLEIFEVRTNLGNLKCVQVGDADNTIASFFRAADLANKIGDLRCEAINIVLGIVYSGQQDYESAIECLERATDIARDLVINQQ